MKYQEKTALYRIARHYGFQQYYYDNRKIRHCASVETILALLQGLNLPIDNHKDIINHYENIKIQWWQDVIEPINIAWDGFLTSINLRLPLNGNNTISANIVFQDGNIKKFELPLKKTSVLTVKKFRCYPYRHLKVPLRMKLPYGYHKLTLDLDNHQFCSTIISAPKHAYDTPTHSTAKHWGLFCPLYALHSKKSFGAGDLTDFNKLIDWSAQKQASLVGTLPLFASYLEEPFDPSPYSPASKLFFNEFYLDITNIFEFKQNKNIQNIMSSSKIQQTLQTLRKKSLVDYTEVMALKKYFLQLLADAFFKAQHSERNNQFNQFIKNYPEVEQYAIFRATLDKLKTPWQQWPSRLREGNFQSTDYDKNVKNYYLYVQWQIQQQLDATATNARLKNIHLYLDMPLGVHPQSYDSWRYQHLFAQQMTVGAPPDDVFIHGQNWCFPPLIPFALRNAHYDYYIAVLRRLFPYISVLRIDHVMALHRVYCIPKGFNASNGAYLQYPAAELYAILCLESHQYKVCLIGEDLGIVPKQVNQLMQQHHFQSMYIAQYELDSNHNITQAQIPQQSIASINTHDMPPFAGYLKALDLKQHYELGILNDSQYHLALKKRQQIVISLTQQLLKHQPKELSQSTINTLLIALLQILASSQAAFFLINIEDLWLTTDSQNIPTTSQQYPNWRRKTRYLLEEWCQNSSINDTINNIVAYRNKDE